MTSGSYIIRGGLVGRERLRVLSRVMREPSLALLERASVVPGMQCLDVGCGSGDFTLDIASRLGPTGSVIGIDIDAVKLGMARADAEAAGVANVSYVAGDVADCLDGQPLSDMAHARFLLTHLREPADMLGHLVRRLRPGGLLVIQDIEVSHHVVHPPSWAVEAFVDIYRRTALARGADPDIGRRLPAMLRHAGISVEEVGLVQPLGVRGDVRLICALTMEAIAEAALGAGTVARERLDEVVAELYRLAADDVTLLSMARVVQVWGRKPS